MTWSDDWKPPGSNSAEENRIAAKLREFGWSAEWKGPASERWLVASIASDNGEEYWGTGKNYLYIKFREIKDARRNLGMEAPPPVPVPKVPGRPKKRLVSRGSNTSIHRALEKCFRDFETYHNNQNDKDPPSPDKVYLPGQIFDCEEFVEAFQEFQRDLRWII